MKTMLLLGFFLAYLAAPLIAEPIAVGATLNPLRFDADIDGRNSGDVVIIYDDGGRQTISDNQPCLHPRVSSNGHFVGWTTGKITKTKQNGTTLVNDKLCIAANRKIITTLQDPLMIEDWGFHQDEQTVVIKSRGFHGPATIYRVSIDTGKTIATYKADAANLPEWAQEFSDKEGPLKQELTAAPEEEQGPNNSSFTPIRGTPLRKVILDALRAEVAAEQRREDADTTYAPAVFTPTHFNVSGSWAFIDTQMKPDYGEQNSVIAVLHLVQGQWFIKFTSYADDVTDYQKLASRLEAPRSIFPKQGKIEE